MWPFSGKKRLVRLLSNDRILLSDNTTITFEELVADIELMHRDIASLNSGVNRIERKQNRWLDVLNIREREPTNQVLAPENAEEWKIPPGNPDLEESIPGQETED
ncbi:hypothetical protein ES703_71959 [subsurface metagenome]